MPYDLLIQGGTVVDGTGGPARTADVAVTAGRIVEVGRIEGGPGAATRTIDADGLLVTPGFVDIHTHYDGQASWGERMIPSSWHGVTTVVAGNCGVGFAPVRPADHARLIELMQGVEDLPGTVLHEGLAWNWQWFASFLDSLESRARPDVDVAVQVLPRAAAAVRDGRARRRPGTGDRGGHRRDGCGSRPRASKPGRSGSQRRARSTTARAKVSTRRPSPPTRPSWSASHERSAARARACCRSSPISPMLTASSGSSGDGAGSPAGPCPFSLPQARGGTWYRRPLDSLSTAANAEACRCEPRWRPAPSVCLIGLQCSLHPLRTPGDLPPAGAPPARRAGGPPAPARGQGARARRGG